MNIRRYLFLCLIFLSLCISSFKPAAPSFYGIKKVVIDAGHGGHDGGCSGTTGSHEKQIALSIALKLGKYIEENFKDVEVIYTRKTDVFVELNERAAIANRNNADIFICIHCNSNPKNTVIGAETYIMGLHKTKGNLDVAKRENASILYEKDYKKNYDGFDPSSDEASIIFSMYQNAFLEKSISFASKVQNEFVHIGRPDREVRQAGFLVLWKTAMPSALIETGFLSNAEEEKFLKSKKNQFKMAHSIYKAFKAYKYEVEGRTLTDAEKNEKVYFPSNEKLEDEPELPEVKVDEVKKDSVNQKLIYTNPNKINNTENKEVATTAVIFKIQITSSEKKIPLNSPKFNGLEGIQELFLDGVYRYTYGETKVLDEATKIQHEVRDKGFKDAFVVAFTNGKKIPVSEALNILKNTSNKTN